MGAERIVLSVGDESVVVATADDVAALESRVDALEERLLTLAKMTEQLTLATTDIARRVGDVGDVTNRLRREYRERYG